MKILTLRGWLILAAVVVAVLFVVSYCQSVDRAKRSATETEVAQAQAGVGSVSSEREADQRDAERDNAAVTKANTENIQGAENANETAGDAGRRGQLAYCERQRVRGKPLPVYCS